MEEASGLYRMKAQLVSGGEIGWVTLKGNAGSQFLQNCDLPSGLDVEMTPAEPEADSKAEPEEPESAKA
jgi:hypothetical protein